MNLFTLPSTEEDAVAFLQEKGILPANRLCQKKHEMKIYFEKTETRWHCNKSACRTKTSIRNGNWLMGSTLTFAVIVRFIYGWSYEYTSGKWCERELGIDKGTAVDWNNYMREVCIHALLQRPRKKIGGRVFVRLALYVNFF